MAQGQLLAHHPGGVTGGRNQAQNHADTEVRPRFDSEMPTTGTPPNDTAQEPERRGTLWCCRSWTTSTTGSPRSPGGASSPPSGRHTTNGVTKVIYRDADGNEISFGGGTG
jgi:hypothetical protein